MTKTNHPLHILCISTYFKGQDFIKQCKADGNHVYLLTKKKLENEDWPWECIDETFYIEDWNERYVKNGIAYTFRSTNFDRFVALDDFDVDRVADLREHFRIPGMGQTTVRSFRDKLSMRMEADECDIPVPAFSSLFNDEDINQFIHNTPSPWLIKPRDEASATGIKKIHSGDQLWELIHQLGDDRHRYLVEKFEPGQVFHVDSITFDNQVVFSTASGYLDTPFEVAHGGGIFRSQTLLEGSPEEKSLKELNARVISSFGLKYGASHTEFIRSNATGKYYFLETSSRVGGANIAEMVEFASGLNLWKEWARTEDADARNVEYVLPEIQKRCTGIVVSLSRYEYPDYSSFQADDILWHMHKPWHIGMIVTGDSPSQVEARLNEISGRIHREFHASLPAPDSSHD